MQATGYAVEAVYVDSFNFKLVYTAAVEFLPVIIVMKYNCCMNVVDFLSSQYNKTLVFSLGKCIFCFPSNLDFVSGNIKTLYRRRFFFSKLILLAL